MRVLFLLFSLLSALILSGCVSQQPLNEVSDLDRYQRRLAQINDWELKGRINVRVPGESDTVNVTWKNQDLNYNIYLRGSFGIGATRITGEPGLVKMEQGKDEPIVAHSAEELIYTQFGREIPINDLHYWIRGLRAPFPEPQQITYTEHGTLEQLQQNGWSLEYSEYMAVGEWNLPKKIVAQRDDLRLTLFRMNWALSEQE